MRKLIFIGLFIAGISGVAYASYQTEQCKGAGQFIENLNLDESRAAEVEHILSSYKQVKDLAKSGQYEQIPQFIEDRQAELAAVLTEKEMQQFKENVGQWAEGKNFAKFMKFSGKSYENTQH